MPNDVTQIISPQWHNGATQNSTGECNVTTNLGLGYNLNFLDVTKKWASDPG